MLPIVARYPTDAAADALGEPVILAGSQQVAVERKHLLAGRCHLRGRQSRVDIEVFERAVEPCDVLLEAKGLAVEAPGHVENGIAAQKTLVAERDQDLALAGDPAGEPSNTFVAERHCYALATRPLARAAPAGSSSASRLLRSRRAARRSARSGG